MNVTPENCVHLTTRIVSEIHTGVIAQFGGAEGACKTKLLESAIRAPQARLSGKSPFHDFAEVAAAYLFFLSRNRPFAGENKRTALGACLVFLRLNGIEPAPDGPEWESLTLAVASSEIDRDETTRRLRKLLSKRA